VSEVRPFHALRFARDPGPRIAPPYDVIGASEREALARERENIVHLTLPPGAEGERDYAGAAQTCARWKQEAVLRRDSEEQLYILEERVSDGRVRVGFLGLLRLADYEERIVLPHERTMRGPKHDRLLLTRALRANLEPLFFLYEDRDAKLDPLLHGAARGALLSACTGPDATQLSLHAGPSAEGIAALRAFLSERPVIIADGHHRYETMLSYRDECRAAAASAGPDDPHEFVLAYLVNAFDPGSEIRAIHRVLTGSIGDVKEVVRTAGFQLEECNEAGPEELLELLRGRCEAEHAFVLVRSGGSRQLAWRPRGAQLDVEVLHEELLPGLGGELSFDSKPARLLERVEQGEVELGILLSPLDPESLFRVVQAGRTLPQKSTFFSPKIPSGLVLRDLY